METSYYQNCQLCPRECGVNRLAGERGYCGETAACRISSAMPHFGEEPSFTGQHGSGTIFFSGCSCKCFFCQNYQISHEGLGTEIAPDKLVTMAEELVHQGVHNINFVTPDHFWPHVSFACRTLREHGIDVPFVFNCSGYEHADMVENYAEDIDIFLMDFKFASPDLARHCMNDQHYPELALASLQKMVELKGFLEPWDPTGENTARKGVLVRHLVLPGQLANSFDFLRLLRNEFGKHLPISIMSQFRPVPECANHEDLMRGVTDGEFQQVVDLITELEFDQGYIQNVPTTDAFMPDFSKDKPFRGNQL